MNMLTDQLTQEMYLKATGKSAESDIAAYYAWVSMQYAKNTYEQVLVIQDYLKATNR